VTSGIDTRVIHPTIGTQACNDRIHKFQITITILAWTVLPTCTRTSRIPRSLRCKTLWIDHHCFGPLILELHCSFHILRSPTVTVECQDHRAGMRSASWKVNDRFAFDAFDLPSAANAISVDNLGGAERQ
jgi:hypothetical protein